MNPKRLLYPRLLIAVLVVTACSPKATPEPVGAPTVPIPTNAPTPMSPTDTPAPTAIAQVPTPTLSEVTETTVSEGEVPAGLTDDGAPYRGDPNAPVTLVEYSDFQ
jgi:protein-disulfide isomerase